MTTEFDEIVKNVEGDDSLARFEGQIRVITDRMRIVIQGAARLMEDTVVALKSLPIEVARESAIDVFHDFWNHELHHLLPLDNQVNHVWDEGDE